MITKATVDVEIGDVTYQFRPPELEDFERLELRMRAKFIEAARLGAEGAPEDEKLKIVQAAVERAQDIDVFIEMKRGLNTQHMAYMFWLMVRDSAPGLTLNDIGKWVRDREIMDQIMPKVALLTGSTAKKNPETGKKRKSKKSRSTENSS